MVHSSLKGSLALVQRLLVPGQLGGGLADHCLPALEGLSLLVELIFEGMELLLSEAELPLMLASLCFSDGEPSLLQAQALNPGISALLAGVEEGLSVLDFVQPLLGVGKEAVGIGPGLVQEVLSCPLGLLPSQGWVGRPDGGGIFWRASEMISMASWCALARTPLADSLAFARASSASSTALARISSASFLACSRRSVAH
jgi:hypothetical protein